MSTPEPLAAELEQLVRKEQRDKRLPSIAVSVMRDGKLAWELAVGAADVETRREATPGTQYRLGSITKTFTAAAVMQLRDEGALDLEDRLDKHIEGVQQRFADVDELLDTLDRAEGVLPPGARFHYSNLAFALLGIVVERVSGVPYAQYVETKLLQPLGLDQTTFEPRADAATGYLVQPYVEGVWTQAPVTTGAWISAGQLWGTVRDLARWGAFLASPDDDAILRRETVEEMRTLQSLDDHVHWTGGYGLGLQLLRDGERILAGHGGSMPGFIAGVFVSPADKIGVAGLTNSSGARLVAFLQKLLSATVGTWPVPPKLWQVEDAPPDDVVPLLGIWFMEGDEIVFRWREGRLEAQFRDAADWDPPAVFRRESDDRWRIVSGFEHGEVLRIEPERMVLAGYPVTREPTVWV